MHSVAKFWLLLGLVIGLPVGTGLALFAYADGFSYLSKDPAACANCHVMQPQLAAWKASSHHGIATCNDCHTSGSTANRYLQKAENGWHHSLAFTTGNFKEPIRIKDNNLAAVLENCRSCHQPLIQASHFGSHGWGERNCLHCHQQTGHHN